MSQVYGATKESNNLSPVHVSSAERDTGMTTEESSQYMDTNSPEVGGEKKKTSLLKKVKDKAKKLKSKLKPGHHEFGTPTTPTGGQHADDSSSASSQDEEEETPEMEYTALSSAVRPDDDKVTAAAPHGSEDRKFGLLDSPEHKARLATEDPSAPSAAPSSIPLSQLKSDGPPGVEQAVPTEYKYYNEDPSDAMRPGSELRGDEVPSALGGETTGISPIASDSRAFGSETTGTDDKSFSSGQFSVHGSNRSDDSSLREEDRDSKIPRGILTPLPSETESREGKDDSFDTEDFKNRSINQEGKDNSFDTEEFSNRSVNQDEGISPVRGVVDTLGQSKDAALDKVGYGSQKDQGLTSDSPSNSFGVDAATQKPIHQRAYEGLTNAAVGVGQKVGVYRDYEGGQSGDQSSFTGSTTGEPTVAQKAYDSVVGTKELAAEKLSSGTPSSYTQTNEPTIAQKAYDTVVGTKDAAADKISGARQVSSGTPSSYTQTNEPTIAQKAYDTVVGTKNAAADKISGATQASSGTPSSYTQTNEPTMAQKAYNAVLGTKEAAANKISGATPASSTSSHTSTTGPTMAQKAYDTIVGTKENAAGKLPSSTTGDRSYTETGEPTVSQKAYDTVVGAKDAAASKLGGTGPVATTDAESHTSGFFDSKAAPVSEHVDNPAYDSSKPVTQKVGETATGVKDTIANTLGYGSGTTESTTTGRGQQKPITESALETAANVKDTVASKLGQADQNLSSDSTPVSSKATGTLYQAKDSAVSTLSPTEHDKALSQSVTETISNLPGLLSEKLGLGEHSTTPSTTTTGRNYSGPSELDVPVSNPASTLSTDANTPEASPGIVSRMAGAMGSLFGSSPKKPATTEGEYSPTRSPSGSAHRNMTDATPLVTDTSDTTTSHSSPAA